MKSVPLIGFLFSIIYVSWFSKFFFWQRKNFISETIISDLIDSLVGVVYLSIIASLCLYPLDYSLYRLQYASIMGQFDPLWFMEAGYIVLQGMFLYRIFELELKNKKDWGFVIPCLYCHAVGVLLFAFGGMIAKFAGKKAIDTIFSPFQDPHSFGGYLLVLFFYFANRMFGKNNSYINFCFVLSFAFLIFLSGSTSTVLCLILFGSIWAIIVFIKLKKNLIRVGFALGVLIAIYSISEFIPNASLIKKYQTELNYNKALKLYTVTERFELWNQAFGIIKEFPLTGSGIGSYFKISNYYSRNKANSGELRNAHNYYFQFAAELGIPALFLFLLILFFIYREELIVANSVDGKGLLFGLSAYLFSMLSGHHLILSTQQFLFWFVLYAIAFPIRDDLNGRKLNLGKKYLHNILYVIAFLVIVGHVFNLFYAKKEVKGLYEFGLYKPQIVNNVEMRWIDKNSRTKINAKTDCFGFSIYAEPENISSGILEMRIYVNDQLIDFVKWEKKGTKNRSYYVPGIKGKSLKISTNASDSYNPYKRGFSKSIRENRNQSAAITEITFFREANCKIK